MSSLSFDPKAKDIDPMRVFLGSDLVVLSKYSMNQCERASRLDYKCMSFMAFERLSTWLFERCLVQHKATRFCHGGNVSSIHPCISSLRVLEISQRSVHAI
jgi:hypothetical protein